jgi:hypothetical protein
MNAHERKKNREKEEKNKEKLLSIVRNEDHCEHNAIEKRKPTV